MFSRNPDKLDSKALNYEAKGKTAKAVKYREKAARIRANNNNAAIGGAPTQPVVFPAATSASTTTTTTNTGGIAGFTSFRSPARYEQNALKWESRGNWAKAQKNREKVWRLQNPQLGPNIPAPNFYNNNTFVGYNATSGFATNQSITTSQLPATVETHVHPTIVQQTTRPEKIVEVQPVIHREIDAPEVHVVEKHIYERVPSSGPGLVTNQPIVQETVRPRIVEEVQPVIHREVPAPFIERVEQHVTERVTAPTTTTKEVINDTNTRVVAPGIAAGGPGFQQPSIIQQQQQTTTTATAPAAQNQGGAFRQ